MKDLFGIEYGQLYIWILEILRYLLVILIGMLMYRISIHNKLKLANETKEKATKDPLTGGPNRHLFLQDIEKHISKNKKFALCFMDLDGFKQINDTMGHDAGDELLIKLYQLLVNHTPKNVFSYRLGGDEFALIIKDIHTTEQVSDVLDALKLALSKPIEVHGNNIILEYSLGVSMFPADAITKKELLSYADDAMYYVKENGKNNYYFHNKTLKAKLENKTKMDIDLKRAAELQEFDVELQPRIELKDLNKMKFESLVYWNHPTLGYLKAEYFIEQAEELGIVIKLDEYVLRRALSKLDELKKKGYDNLCIAVNMSIKHARRKDFIERIYEIIKEYKINEGELEIEFTDVIDIKYLDNYKVMFEKLKQLGVNITITNMEIKYEVLTKLKELPIDSIKVDVRYLKEPDKFKKDAVKDIIDLCKSLSYVTIMTHIEKQDEFQKVFDSDVDNIQGNYFLKRFKIDMIDEYAKNYSRYLNDIKNVLK